MKVDSKGWKTLARTVRPLIDHLLEEQVREAGQLVSMMSQAGCHLPELGHGGRLEPARS